MSEEFEVLKEVTQRLEKAKICYLISGSMAANYYTIPRMTRDLDVVIELKDSDIARFIQSFKNDFFTDEEVIKEEVKKNGMFNLIHTKYVFKIDFILRKESAWQEAMFARRKKVFIEKIPLWIISLEDLILAKLSWAKVSLSELQLSDVGNLMTSMQLDQSYLKKWILELGLEEAFKKIKP